MIIKQYVNNKTIEICIESNLDQNDGVTLFKNVIWLFWVFFSFVVCWLTWWFDELTWDVNDGGDEKEMKRNYYLLRKLFWNDY